MAPEAHDKSVGTAQLLEGKNGRRAKSPTGKRRWRAVPVVAAVGLLGAMAPQMPANAKSHVSITGTGTNEVKTEFYQTVIATDPVTNEAPTCFQNYFTYESLAGAVQMTVNGTNYTVTFYDEGEGTQSFGNLGGSYNTLDECKSSTNPGRGGDIRTNFDGTPAVSTPPPDQVELRETGTAIADGTTTSVPASCTFPISKGTFSVLGAGVIQSHLDGSCTIGGQTDSDVHLLVNVEVVSVVPDPDPANPGHSTVYQTACFTYKDAHTPNAAGGCDANG